MNKYIGIILFTILWFSGCKKDEDDTGKDVVINFGTMTDQDGKSYKTVVIGTQTWMAENLSTIHYRNGDPIPLVSENNSWSGLDSGAYCMCNNTNNTQIVITYGMLYNWHAVSDSRNIAPTGWHVPTDDEWDQLIDFLGGEDEAAEKMKEKGNLHWSNNPDATNISGFSALPAGYREGFMGTFAEFGQMGHFWSRTQFRGCGIYRDSDNDYLSHHFNWGLNDRFGLSVRLVKDK
jgi:uncharacterized protein (TIGR02145 family)